MENNQSIAFVLPPLRLQIVFIYSLLYLSFSGSPLQQM